MKHALECSLIVLKNDHPGTDAPSGQTQVGQDTRGFPAIFLDTFDGPGDGVAEGFTQHRSTGLADRRQPFKCPLMRTALLQLTHQQTVRQEDQIQVAGLPQATSQLTVAHAQLLLAVPMEALGAWPAAAIHTQHAAYLPTRSIAHQHFAWLLGVAPFPKDHDTHTMVHVADVDTDAERDAAIRSLGLDKPIWVQYGLFLANALTGDLGTSFVYNTPSITLLQV